MNDIGSALSDKSEQSLEKNEFQTAGLYLEKAIELNKEYGMGRDEQLAALESRLSEQGSASKRKKQANELYSKASLLYSQGKVTQPSGDNALTFTRQLLGISVDHPEGRGAFAADYLPPVRQGPAGHGKRRFKESRVLSGQGPPS